MEDLAKVRARYESAINSLTEKLKKSPDVAAVILLGSMSYDTVWEKSDVEITVAVKDSKFSNRGFCLDVDGINVNVELVALSRLRRELEGEGGGSISHSITAKGRILYTADEQLSEFFEDYKKIGIDDMIKSLFYNCGEVIGLCEKTHKWIDVRRDLMYAQLFVIKAAESAARLEVIRHREPPTREVLPRALELNPELFTKIYTAPLTRSLTKDELNECCRLLDNYLTGMLDLLRQPLDEVMLDGELMTISEIATLLHCGTHYLVHIFDFFVEKGILLRTTRDIKLLPRGGKAFEEVAFINYKDGLGNNA